MDQEPIEGVERVEGDVLEVDGHSDQSVEAGTIYLVRCPACRDEVRVASSAWWSQRCSCGLYWKVEIVATGERGVVVR